MGRWGSVARSLLYASGFVATWWWVVVWARPLDGRIPIHIPESLRLPGLLVAGLGAMLAAWCVGTFALVGRGTPAPFDAPRRFVAVGPYRYLRNPMYLGAIAVIAGAGLATRSPSALAVAAVFAALAHAFVVFYEEPTLRARFGDGYEKYSATVSRWLPRLRRG